MHCNFTVCCSCVTYFDLFCKIHLGLMTRNVNQQLLASFPWIRIACSKRIMLFLYLFFDFLTI